MTLTAEQQAIRARGVGSSEIAMLVTDKKGGWLSPYGGPHTLWRRKTGRETTEIDAAILARGNFLERGIADWWAADHGVSIKPGKTIVSERYPYCVDTIDFLTSDGEGLEVKAPTPRSYHKWGAKPPAEFLVQCQWHAGHNHLGVCHLTADVGFDRADHPVPYSEEIFHALVSLAEKFWVDHVLTDKEPEADAFAETGRWLSRQLPDGQGEVVECPGDLVDDMEELASLIQQSKDVGAKLTALENRIKQAVGPNSGLHMPGNPKAKVTFATQAGRKAIDWSGVAASLGIEPDVWDAAVEANKKPGGPFRVFRKDMLVKHI